MNIYLTSTSPRRSAILSELLSPFNLHFQIIKPFDSDFEEILECHSAEVLVNKNARGKIESLLKDSLKQNSIYIGADTVIYFENKILGKPKDKREAKIFLKKLSGKVHSVFTGVAVWNSSMDLFFIGHEKTKVTFKNLKEKEIDWYISTHEPLGKAGAYAIQGLGEIFIKSIEGTYSNVVGLPKGLTCSLLKSAGIDLMIC